MATIDAKEVKRLLDILDDYATNEIKRAFAEIAELKGTIKTLSQKVDKLEKKK